LLPSQNFKTVKIDNPIRYYFSLDLKTLEIIESPGKIFDGQSRVVGSYTVDVKKSINKKNPFCKSSFTLMKNKEYFAKIAKQEIKKIKTPEVDQAKIVNGELKVPGNKNLIKAELPGNKKESKKSEKKLREIIRPNIPNYITIYNNVFSRIYDTVYITRNPQKINIISELTFSGIRQYLVSIENQLRNKYNCTILNVNEIKRYFPRGDKDRVFVGLSDSLLQLVYWEGREYQAERVHEETLEQMKNYLYIPLKLKKEK